jgi:hypothetical protein
VAITTTSISRCSPRYPRISGAGLPVRTRAAYAPVAPAYRLMHAHARLGDADRDRLARGWPGRLGVSHQEAAGRQRCRMMNRPWSTAA